MFTTNISVHDIFSNSLQCKNHVLCFRYASVVESCNLVEDFLDFVDGDQTEVTTKQLLLYYFTA